MQEGVRYTYLPSRGGVFPAAYILLREERERVAKETGAFVSICLGHGIDAKRQAALSRYFLDTMERQAAQTGRSGAMETRLLEYPDGSKSRFIPCEIRLQTPSRRLYLTRFATTQGGPYLGEWRAFFTCEDGASVVVESCLAKTFGTDWLERGKNGEWISLNLR